MRVCSLFLICVKLREKCLGDFCRNYSPDNITQPEFEWFQTLVRYCYMLGLNKPLNMKQTILQAKMKISLLFTSLLLSIVALAQDTKKLDIDINTKSDESNFLMQPWVWVVGGAVFILLLVALLRGNKK